MCYKFITSTKFFALTVNNFPLRACFQELWKLTLQNIEKIIVLPPLADIKVKFILALIDSDMVKRGQNLRTLLVSLFFFVFVCVTANSYS